MMPPALQALPLGHVDLWQLYDWFCMTLCCFVAQMGKRNG